VSLPKGDHAGFELAIDYQQPLTHKLSTDDLAWLQSCGNRE
jgi:hypothetical protein